MKEGPVMPRVILGTRTTTSSVAYTPSDGYEAKFGTALKQILGSVRV